MKHLMHIACWTALVFAVHGRAEAESCKVDQDCPKGQACDLDDAESGVGTCKAAPLSCAGDKDCPDGLTCSAGACSFAFQQCTADGECAKDHRCISTTQCDPEGNARECGDESKLCYPNRIDCAANQGCPDGWTCFLLSEHQAVSAPVEWEGATSVCFPAGLARALRGEAAIRPERSAVPDAEEASGDKASGCSLTHGTHLVGRRGPAALLALVGVLGVFARTRRRR